MLDWAERVGFRVPDRLAYGRKGIPGAYTGRFRNDWEPPLWFEKPTHDEQGSYFNKEEIAKKAKYNQKGSISTAMRKDGTKNVRRVSGWAAENGMMQQGTLWNYGDVGSGHDSKQGENTGHPARYSLAFCEDAIKCFCPPRCLVCDPFSGSGTTAVAALRQERRFIGGDLLSDKKGTPWAKVGWKRAKQVRTAKGFLFEEGVGGK
jgi:DNA modification methylase